MEVDAIWPYSQDRRHGLSISPFRGMSKSAGGPTAWRSAAALEQR